jgi:hypothetical protein
VRGDRCTAVCRDVYGSMQRYGPFGSCGAVGRAGMCVGGDRCTVLCRDVYGSMQRYVAACMHAAYTVAYVSIRQRI